MPEDIDHIAQLQQRLYARDPENVPKRTFGILRPLKNKVDSTWGQDDLPKQGRSHRNGARGYKRLFIFSFLFFLLALGAALFSLYRGAITLSSKNVEMTILGNSFVAGGEALPIQVDVVNKNATDLVEAQITLSYPKGSVDGGEADLERVVEPLGTIGSGKTKTQAFSVVLYGEQGVSRIITATLQYKLAGSNTVFIKESPFSVMINSSPVALTVDAPTSTASNQPFLMTIHTTFTGDTLLNNAVVRVDYPNGYVFSSASPAPDSGNNAWSLGDLVTGTERTITIKGKLVGDEQDEKAFHIYVGSKTSDTDSRIAVSYNSVLHSVTIAQPFISGSIVIANQQSDVVALPSGADISGVVKWTNNSPIAITNPVFTLAINGDSVDTDTIGSDSGKYDQTEKAIVWSNETNTDVARIESGATGVLPFHFSPKVGATGDITLALSIAGTFPDRDFFQDTISNIDQKIIRFASTLQFASQSLYSIGPIKNTGPFPPRVGKDTTYTVSWTMRPVENPLSRATATAVLPLGSVWTGVTYPSGESLTYDPQSRVVKWTVGSMPKASGTALSRTASFQVKINPTKSQIETEVDLLGETTISATDEVAGTPLSITRPALTTRLSTDPAYSVGKEKVLP
jgi:hypothetical protein